MMNNKAASFWRLFLLCSESVDYRSYRIEEIWFIRHQIAGRTIDYDVVYAARDKLDYRVEHQGRILPDVSVGIDDPVVVFFYVYGLNKALVSICLNVESEVQISV